MVLMSRRHPSKFVRTVTKKTDSRDEPDKRKPRIGKRVTWTPDGSPGDGADTPPLSESPESYGERPATNDERLTGDKPPHWG
jgi:hypothetical protein